MNKLLSNLILLVLLSLSHYIFAQDEWIRTYYYPLTNGAAGLDIHYDHGYLLVGRNTPDGRFLSYSFVTKTDINGEVLWNKMFGKFQSGFGYDDFCLTNDGGFIAVGYSYLLGHQADLTVVKYDACANKEWCKVFETEGNNADGGFFIHQFPDDSYIIAEYWQLAGSGEQEVLKVVKLNVNGDMQWKKEIFGNVPLMADENPEHGIAVSNDLFVISGFCYYRDYGGSTERLKPVLFAFDSDGQERWINIIGQDEDYAGTAKYSLYNNGAIYTVGRFTVLWQPNKPYLFKTDTMGNTIFREPLINDTPLGVALTMNIINDTLFNIASYWEEEEDEGRAGIIRTDTSGNVIDTISFKNDGDSFNRTKITHDNKQLFLGDLFYDGASEALYLYKFNENLEFDSIYTQPFEYDYLCDDLPIISDTLDPFDECVIITEIPDAIAFEHFKKLEIFPNPVDEILHIKLPKGTSEERSLGPLQIRHFDYDYHDITYLAIYDVFGRKIIETPLSNFEEREIEFNVEELISGIYLIVLFNNQNKKLAEGKFVKQ